MRQTWTAARNKLTLAAVEKGKDGIRLLGTVDTGHGLGADGLWVQSLGLRKTSGVLELRVDPVPLAALRVLRVVVRVKLRRVLALLDLARGNNSEHGDLDLTSSLRGLVVVLRRERVILFKDGLDGRLLVGAVPKRAGAGLVGSVALPLPSPALLESLSSALCLLGSIVSLEV